ncbi:hypothetical protein TNCV_1925281 [Trichonephila clavipes]|nr:hypothetical protein TNCV_1925281 [Trichonephila clavipes]
MKDRRLTIRETDEQVEISTGSAHAILCEHAQSGCEIGFQASVVGIEKLRLPVVHDLLDATNVETGFLRLLVVPENGKTTNRVPFLEQI